MTYFSKRVFSNNQDTTFHDYLTNKKGVQMAKTFKSVNDKSTFLSYNDFTILTKTFSKHSNIIGTDLQMNRSIDDKTIGLIYYEKIIDHIGQCGKCRENTTRSNLFDCESIKNIIYAYETHFKNTRTNVYQKNIDFDRWCKKCDDSYQFPSIRDNDPIITEKKPIVECIKIKAKSHGKGRKPIFCSQCDKFIDVCLCSNRWGRIDAIRHVNRQTITSDY
jgi:hypothetical protein